MNQAFVFCISASKQVTDTAYVNVHTTKFPAVEIRGQLRQSEGDQGQNSN